MSPDRFYPTPPLSPREQEMSLDLRPSDCYWLTFLMFIILFFDFDASGMSAGRQTLIICCKGCAMVFYFWVLKHRVQKRIQESEAMWKNGHRTGEVWYVVDAEGTAWRI